MTAALIIASVVVYWYELAIGRRVAELMDRWGLVPATVIEALAGDPSRLGVAVTPLTAMFLHTSWIHLLGNMIYLWFFGRLAETVLGPVRFGVVYLAAGAAAALAHVAASPSSTIPAIGASGAIAGLVGAYFPLRFDPRSSYQMWRSTDVLAVILIVLWLLSLALGGVLQTIQGGEGTALFSWWGHFAGFLTGLILVSLMRFVR